MVVAVAGITIYAMQVLGDANSMMDNISQAVNRTTQKRDVAMSIEERDPFSILLLGIDTGALGRTEQGRSDSMMVVTINPEKKTINNREFRSRYLCGHVRWGDF